MSRAPRFSLVGPGRAGLSLHHALVDIGWESGAVYGRGDDPSQAAVGVDLCIVATPDAVIEQAASAIQRTDAILVHLSAATPLAALGDHRAASLHPLVSLADPKLGAAALRTAYFAVAGDPIAQQMAEALSGRWFALAEQDRAIYHAAAVVASNHLVALFGQVERLAGSIDMPFEAFVPLIEASVANTKNLGARAALTGPAARGDVATIELHRAALGEHHPRELASYDALVELAERLAGRLGES